MPAVDVAPIYSDPFVQDHYEGMARLIEAVPDTADKTINAITCRFYCVRFFYTSVNRRRWVEVSAIVTWQDTEDRFSHPCCTTGHSYFESYQTYFYVPADNPAGFLYFTYFAPPTWKVDDTLIGIGLQFSIQTGVHPDSYISMNLFAHDSDIPIDAVVSLVSEQTFDQSMTYALLYKALAVPLVLTALHVLTLRIQVYAKEGMEPGFWMFYKAPFLRFERTI